MLCDRVGSVYFGRFVVFSGWCLCLVGGFWFFGFVMFCGVGCSCGVPLAGWGLASGCVRSRFSLRLV